jgi:hypothetical protein
VSSCSCLNGFSLPMVARKVLVDRSRSAGDSSRKSSTRRGLTQQLRLVLALIALGSLDKSETIRRKKHKTVLFCVVEPPWRLKLSYCNKSLAMCEKENWCCSCGGADVAVGKKSRRKPSCRLKVLCSRLHEVTIGC